MSVNQSIRKARKHLEKGEIAAARELFQAVLDKFPSNRRALEGLQAAQQGGAPGAKGAKPHPVAQSFDQLIRTMLGLMQQQRFSDVYSLGVSQPTESINKPIFFNVMGVACAELGNYPTAVTYYKRALELNPRDGDVHNNLGIACFEMEDYDDAVFHYSESLRLKPGSASVYSNLGNALDFALRPDDALEAHRKAVELDPNFVGGFNNLGIALQDSGNFEEAMNAFRKAIALKADYVPGYLNLSTLSTFEVETDPLIGKMESLLTSLGADHLEAEKLHFALAKAYSDLGNQAKELEHLSKANRKRKQVLGYEIEKERAAIKAIPALYSGENATQEISETSAPAPVFILSAPRSGSTLVEQILGAHSEIEAGGELETVQRYFSRNDVSDILSAPEKLSEFRDFYLGKLSSISSTHSLVTDKMPHNSLYAGALAMAIPSAKFVYVRRNAVATAWSLYKHRFSSAGNGFAYDLDDITSYLELHAELMAFWIEMFPNRFHVLKYESLTEHQEQETRAVLAFLGLSWEERCMNFHEHAKVVRTSSYRQVRSKIYQGSSEAWRAYEEVISPHLPKLQEIESMHSHIFDKNPS